MNEELKIETGVPIPEPTVRATRWAAVAENMKIKQSYLVANANEATGLVWALKRREKKSTQRLYQDGTVRVWRTA